MKTVYNLLIGALAFVGVLLMSAGMSANAAPLMGIETTKIPVIQTTSNKLPVVNIHHRHYTHVHRRLYRYGYRGVTVIHNHGSVHTYRACWRGRLYRVYVSPNGKIKRRVRIGRCH